MTYHVVPIGVTLLVIYLFSLYLSCFGFTPRQSHRRFWNWILLFTFLIAGLFGLFLALRITYRWEISFAESLLHWHVETGIAMVFASFIHLSWHLGYYFRRSRIRENNVVHAAVQPDAGTDATGLRPLLLLTGFVSSASQFILLREAAILGGGTEAMAGLFLWLWLIIAAGGAVTGSCSVITSMRRMVWTLLAGTALAPLCFLMMNQIILTPGQTPSFLQALVILAVSVTPVTFVSALIFVRISVIRNAAGIARAGNSFTAEMIGSVAAGVLTALTVTIRIPNYQLYLVILAMAVAFATWFLGYRGRIKIAVAAAMAVTATLLFIFPPDAAIRSLLLRGVKAEKSIDTPFGNITTGVYSGERTVYYDHRPVFFPGDVISAEENIHYALLQRQNYDRVLLVSGGLRRHLPEVMKYSIGELTYLEMDPGLIAAEGVSDTLCGQMRVRVVRDDPMAFLRADIGTFDAIIQLIPPPSTLSVDRFYTVEYFRMVREQLSPEGLFMCTPMPWFNYSPESYRRGFSPFFNALSDVFRHVTLIPGSMLYAVASDTPVSNAVVQLAGQHGIGTSYVNGDYLDDNEIKTKSEQIMSNVDRNAGMNTALRPVISLFSNILSLERMGMKGGIITLLVLLMIIPFAFISRGGQAMFASSAGLAGFGMILIFILQMTAGNIYILTSVILTLLMAGLAAGATLGERLGLKSLKICVLILTGIFTLTGFLAPALTVSSSGPVLTFIFVMLPAAGIVTGAIYRILTSHPEGRVTGIVYSADMAGSALGYLTVATLLVPLAGTANSCFILALFILLSGIVASVTGKA
ncbi:MAG TPA: hypothetical protein PKV77_04045 [Bacteroidales bacterium]|nr:hypothetical protein [Bacteroidales bacterium]HPH74650.1 hypothetical protein [Bacteroidales bacterium]HPV26326.1 hypothetical protein [Bacteroidales bacterium]